MLAFAVTAALLGDIVAEHCPEHEVFLGCKFLKRFVYESFYCIEAGAPAEIQIYFAGGYGLCQVFDSQPVEPVAHKRRIRAAHCT